MVIMSKNSNISADELLEKIFYYMNQLVVEKDFHKSVLLLADLGKVLVNAERTSFWCIDDKKKQYWTVAAIGEEKICVPQGTGIVGAAIEGNETIVIDKPYEDNRFNKDVDKKTGYITRSILCMPVMNEKGQVIGAYQAINKMDAEGFDEKDSSRLTLAAAFCGKLLEAQILREQNVVDQLTGLKNRKAFYSNYDTDIIPALADKKCSIIMCDIDFFKKVNDTYGHNVGDAVLMNVADLFTKLLDGRGVMYRWGGEEFVILLVDKNKEEARVIAEELRCAIEQAECYCENHLVKVTMSFGINEIDGNLQSNENIKVADDNLYTAKKEGRNRVIG